MLGMLPKLQTAEIHGCTQVHPDGHTCRNPCCSDIIRLCTIAMTVATETVFSVHTLKLGTVMYADAP